MTLGDHFDGCIAHQIEIGRYSSASEVVRAGLRVLEDKENKLDVLRQMHKDGEQSGKVDCSYATLMDELDAENNI